MPAATGGELPRLSALIARQREELDQLTAAAAARSVIDLARGVLMERLVRQTVDSALPAWQLPRLPYRHRGHTATPPPQAPPPPVPGRSGPRRAR